MLKENKVIKNPLNHTPLNLFQTNTTRPCLGWFFRSQLSSSRGLVSRQITYHFGGFRVCARRLK